MVKNFTKQFFFQSITAFFVLVFGVFLFGNTTNASTNTTTNKIISLNGDLYAYRGTSFGGIRFDDITDEDGTLVCYVAEHKTSKPYTMTYNPATGDDISMTAFQHNAEYSWGWNNAIFYLVDVPTGDFGIDLNTTGVVSCVWVASNILEGQFIDYTNPGVGNFNTFSTTTDATTLVLHFTDNPWGSYTWWNNSYTDLMLFSKDIYYHHGEYNAFNIFGFDTATPPEQYSDIDWGSESFTITLDRKSQANGTIFYSTLLFDSPEDEVPSDLPDPDTGRYGYFYFNNSYSCASNSSCTIRYNYNQNYIPEDTNVMSLKNSGGTVVATSTIENLAVLGKSYGDSFITLTLGTTTPGVYQYYATAEEDTDDLWVFSAPIIINVFDGSIPVELFPDLPEEEASSSNIFLNTGKSWWNKLKNIFPFNFPVALLTAWESSESTTLTADLEFLDMTEDNGDINAHFPAEWISTSTDMEFTLFGADMIANGSQDATDLFANFKKFTKWLQLFAFAFGVFVFARKLISELTQSKLDL